MEILEGRLTSLIESVEAPADLIDFFDRLRHGRAHSLLFESKEVTPRFGNFSIGSHDPALKLWGGGASFEVRALNDLGRALVGDMAGRLDFCDALDVGADYIRGTLKARTSRYDCDEMERLKGRTHADILRALAFAYRPLKVYDYPYGGLFGVFGYDFIDQFEQLPPNAHDPLHLPDWLFYYVDNLFVVDHRVNTVHLIANALGIAGVDADFLRDRCRRKIDDYTRALSAGKRPPAPPGASAPPGAPAHTAVRVGSDTTRQEYTDMVRSMQQHIKKGDAFQIVPSRTIVIEGAPEPLESYQKLRDLNPSPYMFFLDCGDHTLVGSSPEVAVRVQGRHQKEITIRPLAGTRPRGLREGVIDPDLDSRYAVELLTDKKELSEHIMLIDLARNDVAKISIPGTRVVNEPLIIEKFSHVQHLVSNVSGILRPELDALHAYLATMNMGTLTGAPKIEAMKIIRKHEKNKRGYYGGAVAYISPHGDLDSGIVIRSLLFKNNTAYLRVGVGVVYDSIPEEEFRETEHKASACLRALGVAENGE